LSTGTRQRRRWNASRKAGLFSIPSALALMLANPDYRRNGRTRFRTMTLAPDEFIRRFLLHVLPNGFHRIRHYGLLASASCKTNIARARELIAVPVPVINPPAEHDDPDLTASAVTEHRPPCPCCGGRMIIVEFFERGGAPRGPPLSQAGVRTATP
jgi:hypothetical protein